MSDAHRSRYSDHATTVDELGFAMPADVLARMINSLEVEDTPLTIGIFGPWGSGKTSMMRMLHQRLVSSNSVFVWFDAWRYAQEDALWRALLLAVIEALRATLLGNDERLQEMIAYKATDQPLQPASNLDVERSRITKQLDDLVVSLYRNVEREEPGGIEVDWKEAGKTASGLALRLGLSFLPVIGTLTAAVDEARKSLGAGKDPATLFDVFHRERSKIHRDQVRSLEQFYEILTHLIEEWIVATDQRLIVFIDDLDRCLPEQAIGVLEAIKVFLDLRSCIFVLGVDRAVIECGIRVRYKEFILAGQDGAGVTVRDSSFPIEGRDYLEKIVQVPFDLPPLDKPAIAKYVRNRLKQVDGITSSDVDAIATSIANGILRNPRKVKRAINTFRLLYSLSQAQQKQISAPLLAKLVVLQNSATAIYENIVADPPLLQRLEKVARGMEADDRLRTMMKPYGRILTMLEREPLFGPLTREQISELIFQMRTAQD